MAKIGRPGKITESILGELRMAFKGGMTAVQACAAVGIGVSTFQRYLEKHPEFREEILILRENINIRAIININSRIMAGDSNWSKWRLEYEMKKKTERERAKTYREQRKTERIRQQLMQRELDGGTSTAPDALPASEYWQKVDEYFTQADNSDESDEQQGEELNA